MEDNSSGTSPEPPKTTHRGRPFKEMTGMQKFVFVLKVIVCAISFGMIFPNVMED